MGEYKVNYKIKDTIAAVGHHYEETMLKMYRYCFAKVLIYDKLFLVRYVHLLDSHF
jgi:hypothetical protein